jgi:small-conductance mechanosensitive channel
MTLLRRHPAHGQRRRNAFGLCLALCAVAAAAQTNPPELQRAESRIRAIESILERTTNAADYARLEQRLALEQQDLANRRHRLALESDKAKLATHQRMHAKYMLLESIRAVDSETDRPRVAARKLHYKVLELRAERARLTDKLRRLRDDSGADADAAHILEEQIETLDDEILLRGLERDAEEMKHLLSKEAERINDAINALPINPNPTIRMLHAKRLAIRSERRLARELAARIAALLTHRDDVTRGLELTRARLTQVEDEIRIEDKRRRMDASGRSDALKAPLRLLSLGASTKEKIKTLFEKRAAFQEQQLAALNGTLETAESLRTLYEQELAVLTDDFGGCARRLWVDVCVPLALIAALLLLHALFSRRVLPLLYKRDRLFVARRMAGYLVFLLILLVLALFFLEDLKAIATVLGIAGAALVIALQDLCSSFAGWFIIVASGKVRVGDRVEIDGHMGDVIDIQLLRITMLELNNWLGIDEPTGRVIVVPNSFIFKSKVVNFSHVHPYIWSRLDITVTFETPAEEAHALLTRVLTEETREEFEIASRAAEAMEQHYGVADTTYTPKVYSVIADSGVQFSLLYVSHYRRRTEVRNRINARIIAEFARNPRLAFAYPTERHIPTSTPGTLTVTLDRNA